MYVATPIPSTARIAAAPRRVCSLGIGLIVEADLRAL
jgi:hypothetical protein